MFVLKQIGGAIEVTVALPQQVHASVQARIAVVKDSIIENGKDRITNLYDGSKGKVVDAAMTVLQVIDTVETTMHMSIPLVDTIVKVPLRTAIKTIDPAAPISLQIDDAGPENGQSIAQDNKQGQQQGYIVALWSKTVSLPKQIYSRVLVFITNTPGTVDVYKVICAALLPSTVSQGGSQYQLQIGPGYFSPGTGDSTVAITLQYRGSNRTVPPLIARRVHSNMHYPVDLRPFEVVVKIETEDSSKSQRNQSPVNVLAGASNCAGNEQAVHLGQAYTPLSFPPSPDARQRVLATHSRRAQDVLCGARDKLCEEREYSERRSNVY